ncbi:hypothetical protein GCM10010423_57910 [Streptomyces levis]|uniref:Uncharacterized protein n=1 Tax=Streptomyces levis TaxID=285566 RepID=A0ABN3P0B6_9ACTN
MSTSLYRQALIASLPSGPLRRSVIELQMESRGLQCRFTYPLLRGDVSGRKERKSLAVNFRMFRGR